MFGYVKKSTHDAVVAELAAVKAALERETSRLAQVRVEKRTIAGAFNEALFERDALQAKIDRMTGGLKQNRPKIAA